MVIMPGLCLNRKRIKENVMFLSRKRILVFLILAPLLCGLVYGETWRLDKGNELKKISPDKKSTYLLAVAEIKKLVNMGKTDEVREKVSKLKKDYPQLASPDLDSFINAEMFFSDGKFAKAGRAYEEFMTKYPDSPLYEAVLDRQFAVGTAFLAGEKKSILKFFKIRGFAEGVKIMENITDRAGKDPIGVKAAVAVAVSFEKRQKYEDAYQKWSEISTLWPTGEIRRDALLGMGRCKHANYKGTNYDASNLLSARSYYNNFRSRYPAQAKKFEIDNKLALIEEQLAYKNLKTGDYYLSVKNTQSANFYYQMVIDNWPKSHAGKEAKEKMKK